MNKALTETELAKSLITMDDSLIAEGVPLYLRPQECFKNLYGSVRDQDGRKDLFDPITLWFVRKYGYSAMEWDQVIGRIPVLLRGCVYMVQVPLVTEETLIEVKDRVEGLPAEVRDSLTDEESGGLLHEVLQPALSYAKLYTLRVDDVFLTQTARALVRRALFDLENATHSLQRTGDVQGAIFHAHAAGEKFLKAALAKVGSARNFKSLGHDIPKAFEELVKADRGYGWLKEPVQELQRLAPNMELRYGIVPRTLEDGVTAIHATLFLCGSLAQMWILESERGPRTSEFRPGKFYKDISGLDHYCKSVDAAQVEMLCFRSNKFTGSQLFTKRMDPMWCSIYLEVYDQAEDQQLRGRLLAHLRQPGTRVDPADLSVKHVNGPKGMYTVGTIRRKINKS
ncbi:MAG: HEPN domain-containing protein [Acidobacteriaceae bacterium]